MNDVLNVIESISLFLDSSQLIFEKIVLNKYDLKSYVKTACL